MGRLIQRVSVWITIAFTLFGFVHISSILKVAHDAKDDNDHRPQFLCPSSFRENPDLAYEKRLSTALQAIERAVLAENGGNTLAEERIWQIAKDVTQRGSDSMSLEQHNSEWKYSLSLHFSRIISFRTDNAGTKSS